MAETGNLDPLTSETDDHTIYLLDDSSDGGSFYQAADEESVTSPVNGINDEGLVHSVSDDTGADASFDDNSKLFGSSSAMPSLGGFSTLTKVFAQSDTIGFFDASKTKLPSQTVALQSNYADDDDEILELLLMAEIHCVGLNYYSG